MEMSKSLDFELKREGFPVNVGPVEFFIGTSIEDLQRFFGLQEEIDKKIEDLSKQLNTIENLEKANQKELELAVELTKELTRIQYDAALGDGAFDKIYEVFPHTDVLAEQLDTIMFAIAERISEETAKRSDKYNKKKADLLKKKMKKKKQ
ncbi:hypothetical protein RV18_GL001962 [Enterococcus termitis]|nr:hypothetical protein RV18_GL001962 [Enterococcus termitis]